MHILPALVLAAMLAPADAARDVDVLQQALETAHPALYRYTPKRELDRRFAALRALAAQPVDDARFYVEISRLLAAIHCDHTKAEPPASIEAVRKTTPSFLPFRFRIFDGRMYVASSDVLARGTEVVAIDGRPVRALLAEVADLVAYDGKTRHVIETKLAADADLSGSDFDHFYSLLHPVGASLTLTVRERGAAKVREVKVPPLLFDAWTKLPWRVAYRTDFGSGTTFRMLDDTTGYLRVDSFVNYRKPVDPHTLYGPMFRELAERGAKHLVLDLRENGGGSTDAAIALAQYFARAPFRLTKSVRLRAIRYGDLPQYVETWGDRKAIFEPAEDRFRKLPDGMYEEVESTTYEPVAKDRFDGRVTVLAGPANASGTTMLLARLRELRPVRVVGAPTGGSAEGPSAGQIFFVRLPKSGITVRVPVKRSDTDVRAFRAGFGVMPDVRVEETLDDFLSGRDRVLEVALAH